MNEIITKKKNLHCFQQTQHSAVHLASMEFGHGDLMVLNFVLMKHSNIKNIVD